MKELSVFIDESGDWGEYEYREYEPDVRRKLFWNRKDPKKELSEAIRWFEINPECIDDINK